MKSVGNVSFLWLLVISVPLLCTSRGLVSSSRSVAGGRRVSILMLKRNSVLNCRRLKELNETLASLSQCSMAQNQASCVCVHVFEAWLCGARQGSPEH